MGIVERGQDGHAAGVDHLVGDGAGRRFKALEAYLAKPEKDRLINEMKMTTAIYLKSSYLRENALGKMQHIPINIGIAVKGLEYQ